ncbi:MAG: TonB-dependent receptor [Acidobacteria bacterium]|nr:TonB-dependent receptor [Acidobacteriota bacterium]
MGRVDLNLSSNDNIFGRVVVDGSDSALPDTQFFPDGSGRHVTTAAKGSYTFALLAWTRILSPSLLNTARIGYTRNNNYQCACLPGTTGGFGIENLDIWLNRDKLPPIPSQFSIIPGVPFGGTLGIPGVSLPGGHNGPGASVTGGSLNDPLRLIDNTFTYDDSIQLSKGSHSVVIGGDIRRYQENAIQGIWASGSISWNTIQNFLTAGTCGSGCSGFPGINVITTTGVSSPPDIYRGYRQTYGSWYVQDDFRMKSNLTLNFGIRWEKLTGPMEVNGKAATFKDVVKDEDWTQLGDKPLFDSPSGLLKGFTPRFGFAYSLDEKTSIRGGVGFFQEMPLQYAWSLTPFYPPYSDRVNVRNATKWPNPLVGLDPRSPAILSTRQPIPVDPNLKYPYAIQYNLGVERQIAENWVTKVSFLGTRGVSLLMIDNPIQPMPILDANGVRFVPRNAPSINPKLDSTRFYTNIGDSRYGALQLRLERRFSNGLQFSGSYTWGINVGVGALGLDGGQTPRGSGGFQVGDAWSYKTYDKGRVQQDVRQNFNFNYNYELPVGIGKKFGSNMSGVADAILGGWQINGVISARTGLPVDITGGGYSPTSFCRTCAIRPNLKPGASNSPVLGDPSLYFDPSGFEVVPAGYFGNLGRNTLEGPKQVNMDFSFFKSFSFGESKRLQFRSEIFNVLNHPNFTAPASTVFNTDGTQSPTVGRITSTTNKSRQIQFGLKFEF